MNFGVVSLSEFSNESYGDCSDEQVSSDKLNGDVVICDLNQMFHFVEKLFLNEGQQDIMN